MSTPTDTEKEAERRRKIRESKLGDKNPFFGKKHSPETIEKIRQSSTGRKHTSEELIKIGMGRKGKPHTEESKQLMSERRKGKCTGKDNPNFGKPRTEEQKRKQSEAMMGKLAGDKNPFFGKHHSPETIEKLSKRVVSEETKKKISESKTGRTLTEEQKERLRGRKSSRLGVKLTDETKRRIGEAMKGVGKGIPRSEETKRRIGEKTRGHNVSPDGRERIRQAAIAQKRFVGENNPNVGVPLEETTGYIDGSSFLPYCYKFNKRRKQATRDFFHNTCIVCGKHKSENVLKKRSGGFVVKDLMVHHIDHDKDQGCSGKPFNLIPLCNSCHAKEGQRREEYRHYINKILEDGFVHGIWSRQEYIEKVMYGE